MDYFLRLGCWGGVFAVPNAVVDDYIKLASGASLKVLLYILRNNAHPQSAQHIAKQLNLSEEAVEDAFAFWEQLEVISGEKPNPVQSSAPNLPPADASDVKKPEPQPDKKAAVRLPHRADRLPPSEIAARISQSETLRFLFERCEQSMNKCLNGTEQNMLIWLCDYLGFSPEAVIMLVEYCVSIGKGNSRYIETVALAWSDRGITALADVDAEIRLMSERAGYTARVMSALGLNRKPTTKESTLIEEWMNAGHSPELVLYAYEKAADNTGKLSFPYMAKVLEGWKQLGVTTQEQAEHCAKQTKAGNTSQSHSYDLDALDALAVNLVKK